MSANGSRGASHVSGADAAFEMFNRRGVDSAFAIASSVLKGWGTLGEAWIGFSRSQVESNLALLQSLAKCQDPMTAWSLQLDGAQATMSRCMSAASRTSDIASKIAAEALAPLHAGDAQRAA
jgi:hypothetical protein